MRRFIVSIITTLVAFSWVTTVCGQGADGDVLTQHNDIYRTGVYASETSLNPSNVNPHAFGRLFARQVLGQVWGQPLYVRGVVVNGQPHNVVYVATSANWVYGFDADDLNPNEQTPPLMSVSLGSAVQVFNPDGFYTIAPSNGISSTPVIDLGNPPNVNNGTLYVVAKLQDKNFHIFALTLNTLSPKPNAQGQYTGVIVAGTAPGRHSNGAATTITFNADVDHLNRPALLISNNHLVVAFGSGPNNDGDGPNYHGWLMSYSLPDLTQTGVFVTTPTVETGMGGIWQAGNGPAADDQGNIYVMTANGVFQSTPTVNDLADSFVKVENADGALRLTDWYTPPSRDVMQACDLDLGSSGPAIIQNSGKILGAGKTGILYVLDKDNMGRTDAVLDMPTANAWQGAPDCKIGQCFRIAENEHNQALTKQACNVSGPYNANGWNESNWDAVLNSYPHVHGSPVIWELGPTNYNLYVWPEEDFLKVFHFDGQSFSPTPIASSAPTSAAMMSMPGGVLSLSWDGANANTGIVWVSRPNGLNGSGCMDSTDPTLTPNNAPCNAINKIVAGYLEAFAATPQSNGTLTELWNSENNPSNDRVQWFAKESPPTVADGKVFLPEFPAPDSTPINGWNTSITAPGRLLVYGLLPPPAPPEPPPPLCTAPEKWCDRFTPPQCVPAFLCLLQPNQPPPP